MDINADEAMNDLAMQLAQVAKAAAIQAATVAALKRTNEALCAQLSDPKALRAKLKELAASAKKPD